MYIEGNKCNNCSKGVSSFGGFGGGWNHGSISNQNNDANNMVKYDDNYIKLHIGTWNDDKFNTFGMAA